MMLKHLSDEVSVNKFKLLSSLFVGKKQGKHGSGAVFFRYPYLKAIYTVIHRLPQDLKDST